MKSGIIHSEGKSFRSFPKELQAQDGNAGFGARCGWQRGEGHFNHHLSLDSELQFLGHEAGDLNPSPSKLCF